MVNEVTKQSFKPPRGVQSAARRGLRLRERWNRGGLSNRQASREGIGSGVQRASNLANGDNVSLSTIRRMRSFFARHEDNYRPDQKEDDGGPTAGTIAWLLWGGNAGRSWANRVIEQVEREADKSAFKFSGEQCMSSESHQIVGGWFSVFKLDGTTVRDLDNEEIDIESYTKAYIDFTKNYRSANFDHEGPTVGALIDNILIDSTDFAKMLVHEITGLPMDEIPVKKLGHFGSFQLEKKEDFDEVVKGKLMFSIEGQCDREEIEE